MNSRMGALVVTEAQGFFAWRCTGSATESSEPRLDFLLVGVVVESRGQVQCQPIGPVRLEGAIFTSRLSQG
jgi:hypothetical protein